MKFEQPNRNKVLLVFFAVIHLVLARQAYSERTFAKKFEGTSFGEYVNIPIKSGGYLSVSTFAFGQTFGRITKTNTLGVKVWEKELYFDFNFNIYGVSETTDGEYVFVGRQYIGKFGADGRILWVKSFLSRNTVYPRFDTVIALDHGEFIAAGDGITNADVTPAEVIPTILVKFDSSGSVIWSNRLDNIQSSFYLRQLAATESGYLYSAFDNFGKIVMLKFDRTDRLVWAKRLEIENTSFESMASTLDNGAIIVANDSIATGLILLKVDRNGVTQWKKRLVLGSQPERPTVNGDSDGGILITATYLNKILFVKTDQSGNVNFAKTFKSESGVALRGLSTFPTTDGGYFEFGLSDLFNYALKLDGGGMVPGCELFSSIRVSPRPYINFETTTVQIAFSPLELVGTSLSGTTTTATRRAVKVCP
jgi:hypothetical protein